MTITDHSHQFPIPYRRRLLLLALIAVLASLEPLQALGHTPAPTDEVTDRALAVVHLDPRPLAPFQLRDHSGNTFDRARLNQGWHLLMFGFTHCPDVCPVHLVMLNRALQQMTAAGVAAMDLPRVVMVSVDPKRDTREQLAAYVTHFNKAFLGVTGEPEQIQALESSLEAGHRTFSEDVNGNYDVMHTSSVYVIDPAGRAVAQIRPPFNPERLAAVVLKLQQDPGLQPDQEPPTAAQLL